MCEHQHVALFQIRADAFLVQLSLLLIVDEDHDDVSLLGSLGSGINLEASLFSLSPGTGAFVKADDDIAAGFLQVQCMCMTLGAVADDGNGLAIQQCNITIFLIVNSCVFHG